MNQATVSDLSLLNLCSTLEMIAYKIIELNQHFVNGLQVDTNQGLIIIYVSFIKYGHIGGILVDKMFNKLTCLPNHVNKALKRDS